MEPVWWTKCSFLILSMIILDQDIGRTLSGKLSGSDGELIGPTKFSTHDIVTWVICLSGGFSPVPPDVESFYFCCSFVRVCGDICAQRSSLASVAIAPMSHTVRSTTINCCVSSQVRHVQLHSLPGIIPGTW